MANFKSQNSKSLVCYYKYFYFAFIILQLANLAGCATQKGPMLLTPLPSKSTGYNISGQNIIFSNKDLAMSISPLNSSETEKLFSNIDANNPLISILADPQYLVFKLDIKNSSNSKVMYNPAFTTLFDSNMGIHKRLDYTDLYQLLWNEHKHESAINAIKEKFYDLDINLAPGKNISRLLIFSDMDEENEELTITMKEIYIGTSTIELTFGFKLEEQPKEVSK